MMVYLSTDTSAAKCDVNDSVIQGLSGEDDVNGLA